MLQEDRKEITDLILQNNEIEFKDFSELNIRYKVPVGVIFIESNLDINFKDLVRGTDKYTSIEYKDKKYYVLFTLFVNIDSLYSIVRKIEYKYQDIEVYFEILTQESRTHVKNFIDSLCFCNDTFK